MTFIRACLAGLLGLMLATGAHAQGANSDNGRASVLDTLFAKLQSTTDPLAAQALEQAIWEQWTMLPDPDQRQLMLRGMAEMQQQDLQGAIATFTKLIGIAPDLSEPWNKRATVYWLLGNFEASIADICETVKREPRHFGPIRGSA